MAATAVATIAATAPFFASLRLPVMVFLSGYFTYVGWCRCSALFSDAIHRVVGGYAWFSGVLRWPVFKCDSTGGVV